MLSKRTAMLGILASATLCGVVCVAVLMGAGQEPQEEVPDQPLVSRLGDTIEVSLPDLLNKPRAELAALADEWLTKAQVGEKARREGRMQFTLVPSVRLPLSVPVFREAKYAAWADVSLPAYATPEARDSGLALHLARYGDVEAALRLADPADAAVLARIEACRCERNYPIEWTRLTGLMLHVAQGRLAYADVDGGTELLVLHRQLRSLLDSRAAQGPLGSLLLGSGRTVFAGAAAAWRAEKKSVLADQADAALAEWGEAPAPTLPVKPGMPRADLARLLRSPVQGHVLAAASTERAFDVLDLPFPQEGVESVVGFFDKAADLAELLVTYRIRTGENFVDTTQFAHRLEDLRLASVDGPKGVGLRGRSYRLDGTNCEVVLIVHGAGVGAWVRVTGKPTPGTVPALGRDFGAVALDRSFEQNRRQVAPEQRAEAVTVGQPRLLARLTNPLPALKLARVVVQREPGHDLVRAVTLGYAEDGTGVPPLHQVALPLWSALGAARLEGSDANGGCLALTWEDAQTRYTLRLPYENSHAPDLEVLDRQAPAQAAERATRAAERDQTERAARLAAGKPSVRIPRELEQLHLGMTKAQVLQLLPSGRAVLKQDTPDGLSVTFNGDAPRTAAFVVRQLLVRFDDAGKAVEVRARYFTADAAHGFAKWMTDLLHTTRKTSGAPEEQTASWAAAWKDLPPRKPAPVAYRWQDDVTLLTYQRDGGVVEMAVRDCPPEYAAGTPLPPLQVLPRGAERCLLGTSRQDVLTAWGVRNPVTTADGALVLTPPPAAPYEILIVWFDKDRVTRIVARHRQAPGPIVGSAKMGLAVSEAWGRDIRVLGWPLRQDATPQEVLQGLAWLDERTRIRVFWQENDDGLCRLFTEWLDLPRP